MISMDDVIAREGEEVFGKEHGLGPGSPPDTMAVGDVLMLTKLYSRLSETRAKKRSAELHNKIWRMQTTLINATSGIAIFATLLILIGMSGADGPVKLLLTAAAACVPFLLVYALMPGDTIARSYQRLLDDEIDQIRAQISILVSKYGDDARRWRP